MSKNIHTKKQFREDIAYIRQVLRLVEDSLANNNWKEVEEIMQEISGVSANMAEDALENKLQIRDARYMNTWVIDDLLARREEVAS